MNNWIDKMERRYGRFAIPYLINGLMIGQLAVGLIVLLINWQFAGFISLSSAAALCCMGRSGGLSPFCSSRCGWAARLGS